MRITFRTAHGFTAASLLMSCVFLCLQAGCKTPPPTVTELQRLQGTWEGVQVGDKSNDKIVITFTGNSLHYQSLNTTSWWEASFTLPAETNPQQLRATITDYQLPDDVGTGNIGAVIGAIFKIDD